MEDRHPRSGDLVEISASIVMAYIANNPLPVAELSTLIGIVHRAVTGLANAPVPETPTEDVVAKLTRAQIRKSITPDALISFLDGRPYKTLKRHLEAHGLDAQGYRERYGLPADYPTIAASFSDRRAAMAKAFGFGRTARPVQDQQP